MERIFKWLLPALIVVDLALVGSGVLSGQSAVLVVGVVELLALALGLRQIGAAVVRYRRDRAAGLDLDAALEDGLTTILPRPVARIVALEPRLWICLSRWLFRRRPLAPDEFGYSKRSAIGGLLFMVMLTAPVEIFVFELIIPWPWLRWLLALASVYGVIWFFGFNASLKMLPYRLQANGLRVYYGLLAEGFVPYGVIDAVTVERRKVVRSEGMLVAPQEGAIYIACGGRTDLSLRLNRPLTLRGLTRDTPPATLLYLAADEPERLAAALQTRLAVATSVTPAAIVLTAAPGV